MLILGHATWYINNLTMNLTAA